jgi:hypothetical protein
VFLTGIAILEYFPYHISDSMYIFVRVLFVALSEGFTTNSCQILICCDF